MSRDAEMTQRDTLVLLICAGVAALGTLFTRLTPIFLVVAFLGVPVGMVAAEAALRGAQARPGPLTARAGVAGVVAGTAAASILTGSLDAALVWLVYLVVVGYVVYWRLK